MKPPINDFSARYDEPTVGAHGNPREVIWGIIAGLIGMPLIWFAICLFLQLDEIFK